MTGQRRRPRAWRGLLRWRKTYLSPDLMVRAPQHRKRAAVVILVLCLIGWGCLMVLTTAPYGAWYRGIASGVLGSFIGLVGLTWWRRQMAYKLGWIEGRARMVANLRKVAESDGTVGEWLDSEWRADAVLMGLDPDTGESRSERRKHERQVRAGRGDSRGWRGWGVRAAGRLRVHLARYQRSAGSPATPGGERVGGDDREAS